MHISLTALLFALSRALDFVEKELLGTTAKHGKRVAYICLRLHEALGFTASARFDLVSCAILHDCALPAGIVKHGKTYLSKLESDLVHCREGEKHAVNFPFLDDVSGVILHHHENWDGTGYHELKGDDIPLRATLLRLADNLDLHLHLGDGRKNLASEIIKHVQEFSGSLYAPRVAQTLLDILDEDFIQSLGDARIDDALADSLQDISRELSTDEVLLVCNIFAMIIDAKSPFTSTHSQGIARKACFLGKTYGFAQEHCNKLSIAGFLHDIGKLSTPLSILEKPGTLDKDEWVIMRNHVAVSLDILSSIQGLEEVSTWACDHHETLDGKGYSRGHGANELPFESRLMACCDIYQALNEDRPYRPGMHRDKILQIMRGMAANNKLDTSVVEHIAEVLPAYDSETYQGPATALTSISACALGTRTLVC
ncbi:MAG: HD domain-containing protein [Deltaproteobacteria bacterium]|jgi:HD-GYP domain-containing protein (c-di-GMP phosphodiesterase class II)|nr:HD domain-containing protein [Deltaproteobacteria bacterium]